MLHGKPKVFIDRSVAVLLLTTCIIPLSRFLTAGGGKSGVQNILIRVTKHRLQEIGLRKRILERNSVWVRCGLRACYSTCWRCWRCCYSAHMEHCLTCCHDDREHGTLSSCPWRNEISKTQCKEIQGSFIQPELLLLNAGRRIASKQRSRNTYIPAF